MNVVFLHTDFRIYWPARLNALNKVLNKRGDILEVIEIAGEGSHYAFSKKENQINLHWHILFPKEKPEDLNGNTIQKKLFPLLDSLQPDIIIAGAIAYFVLDALASSLNEISIEYILLAIGRVSGAIALILTIISLGYYQKGKRLIKHGISDENYDIANRTICISSNLTIVALPLLFYCIVLLLAE